MNGIKKLIIDEMYSYVGSKSNRCYIWTGLVLYDNQKYPVFHISKTKGINDLDEFVRDLPNFDIVYSDKNPVYKEYYGKRNISQKGIETNLVESLNSQLRHYCSQLIRRTKTYAKCMVSLNANLIQILFDKLLKST
jgi:IS1 family transposase